MDSISEQISGKDNMNKKPRPSYLRDQVPDIMEPTAEWSKEAFEAMGSTNEAAEAMQSSLSTALKGIQEYNGKIVEFTQANTQSHIEFVQRLVSVKSPLDFAEIFNDHSRRQLTTLAEQAKELAALVEEIAGSATEPLKTGFEKVTRAARYQDTRPTPLV